MGREDNPPLDHTVPEVLQRFPRGLQGLIPPVNHLSFPCEESEIPEDACHRPFGPGECGSAEGTRMTAEECSVLTCTVVGCGVSVGIQTTEARWGVVA